jgi:hypothetical protein
VMAAFFTGLLKDLHVEGEENEETLSWCTVMVYVASLRSNLHALCSKLNVLSSTFWNC